MTNQKEFKPIVNQPLRVQKIKRAGHRHFRTFLAITVWSGEEQNWFFLCFFGKNTYLEKKWIKDYEILTWYGCPVGKTLEVIKLASK